MGLSDLGVFLLLLSDMVVLRDLKGLTVAGTRCPRADPRPHPVPPSLLLCSPWKLPRNARVLESVQESRRGVGPWVL